MSYLIAVAATFALLVGFLGMSWLETRSGVRVLGRARARLDKQVARGAYVAKHIDWAAFVAHVTKATLERIAHDVVHIVLLGVRASERTLTRTIRTLRERVAARGDTPPDTDASPLIATIVKFRKSRKKEQAVSLESQ